jgi:hypothetical protein
VRSRFLRRFSATRPAPFSDVNRRKTDDPMKKPAVGETDKLRALSDDPELRTLAEQYFAAKPTEREPYEALLEAFIAKAVALYPDWRETWEAAKSDGRIVRALAIHCVLRIRARNDLAEFERFEAKTAEGNFVASFDEVAASPDAAVAFRMMLSFYELMRIAKLDPEEMEELGRRAVRDSALNAGNTPKRDSPRRTHANELISELAKEHPGFLIEEIVEEIPNRWRLKGVACFTPNWLRELVRRWRRDNDIPPPTHGRRRTYPLRRASRDRLRRASRD